MLACVSKVAQPTTQRFGRMTIRGASLFFSMASERISLFGLFLSDRLHCLREGANRYPSTD
jgi:hypothetical protein